MRASSKHDPFTDSSLVDYNRSSMPLLEIVSKPDFRSAEEVVAYLEKLRSMLKAIGVSDCKMQEGSLRADVNVSVRGGTRGIRRAHRDEEYEFFQSGGPCH